MNLKKTISNRKRISGFTLVEMMMTSVIAIIIIAFITSFFLNAIIGKQMFILRQELNYNLEYALKQITYQLKKTNSVDEINSVFGSHPGSIQISTPNANENPLVISSNGTNLSLQKGTNGPYELITQRNELTHISFNFQQPNNSPGLISGTITLQSKIDPSVSLSEDFSISLRNTL